jgi:hypothetical protein
MASASDVPGRYDIVLDGHGYVLLDALTPNIPFRTHRAIYTFSPTFLERTNVTGAYGDDQQDFWMTVSQKDWSEGEGQAYFRSTDQDSVRKFWASAGVDVASIPGRVFNRFGVTTITPAGTSYAGCGCGRAISVDTHAYVSLDTATHNLHTIDATGADTTVGAHGSGVPNQWGMCNDSVNVYIAGATRITKWTGAAFSSFSATANAGSLAYINNALYSCDGSTLNTYDGTGTKTTIFTWKDATNTALTALGQNAKLVPFGGKLLIFFPYLYDGPELWIYDGIAPSRLAVLPDSMYGFDCEVVDGIVFMSGTIYGRALSGSEGQIPCVYYYANGNIGELWRDTAVTTGSGLNGKGNPALGNFGGRLIWLTDSSGGGTGTINIREYDPGTGAICVVSAITRTGNTSATTIQRISVTPSSIVVAIDQGTTGGGDKLVFYPGSSTATGAYIISSLFDFDSNLTKTFRSFKVETQGAASGFDIYYSVDSLTSFTLLQASAASGTEYTLPANTQGRAISVKIVLNGTILQRYYVRAAPTLTTFKTREYILDMTGAPEDAPRLLRDGTPDPTLPHDAVVNLVASASSATPISITDRLGTFTGIIEPDKSEIYEMHAQREILAKSGSYVAKITVREI